VGRLARIEKGLIGIKDKWFAFAEVLGNIVSHIVLSVFYVAVMLPISIGLKLTGTRFIDKHSSESSNWVRKDRGVGDPFKPY